MRCVRVALLAAALGGLLATPIHGGLVFNFVPDPGTPQFVMDGFAAAAARWSSVLADNITVNLAIGYEALPSGVIGQTTSAFVQESYSSTFNALNARRTSADDDSATASLQVGLSYSRLINRTADHPNGANSATPYVHSSAAVSLTRANAKALGLVGPSDENDGSIRFSSNAGFDFDPSNGTTSGQYDFETVAAHEIGHVLGFDSVVNPLEALRGSGVADDLPAAMLDLFRYSAASLAAGPGVIDCTADTRGKFFSVDGGTTKLAGFTRGAVYGGGYQAGHWQEFTWVGLMDPAVFPGLQRQISATDLRAFDVIGYTLVPEPGVIILGLLGLLVMASRRMQRN